MASSDEEVDEPEMSPDVKGFFMDLDPSKSYRLKDAYVDDWSSDEVESSEEEPPEAEEDEPSEDDEADSDKEDDDNVQGEAEGEGSGGVKVGEAELNAMFQDDEPQDGEAVESDEEDTAIQKALERFEEAIEADSDSEGDGSVKKPLPPLPDYVKWRFMRLSRCAMRAIEVAGFQLPTPVQTQVIRPALQGMDICCRAVTGSGKTAAFVLPMVDRLRFQPPHRVSSIRGLVLEPTREVAYQCQNVIQQLAKFTPAVTSFVVAGGVPVSGQVRSMQEPLTVAVATPGRLIDLVLNHKCSLADVEILVLDEADKLLSCGFQRDIEEILRHLPARRQTLQFSATMTREVDQLADMALRKPLDIDVGPMGTAQTLRQEFIRVPVEQAFCKEAMLMVVCTKLYQRGVIVFCSRKDTAHQLHVSFSLLGLPSTELHGGMSQAQRLRALADFRERSAPILFTTDVAQRGLDINGCRTVINYNLPLTIKAYIHRVGRTARMGKQGVAVSFVHDQSDDKGMLEQIVRLARVNNATAKAKVTAAPEGVKSRKLSEEDITEWEQKLNAIQGALKDRLQEEQETHQINQLEQRLTVAQNRIEHQEEIHARGKPAWHVSAKERKDLKVLMKAEAEDALPKDKKKRQQEYELRSKMAKFPATDLDNRPITLPAFSRRQKEEEKRLKAKADRQEARGKLGPQKLTNKERRKKRRDKKNEVVAQKRERGTLKTSKKKERAKKAPKKGVFKSKKRYKRR